MAENHCWQPKLSLLEKFVSSEERDRFFTRNFFFF